MQPSRNCRHQSLQCVQQAYGRLPLHSLIAWHASHLMVRLQLDHHRLRQRLAAAMALELCLPANLKSSKDKGEKFKMDKAAGNYLGFLCKGRRVILEDTAVLQDKYPQHKLFILPYFGKSTDGTEGTQLQQKWKAYKVAVIAAHGCSVEDHLSVSLLSYVVHVHCCTCAAAGSGAVCTELGHVHIALVKSIGILVRNLLAAYR